MLRHTANNWKPGITALLVAWLIMMAGSMSLVHAHAGTATSHNLGWMTIVGGQGASGAGDTTARHRHRVILGIELPAEPCPEGEGDDTDTLAATPAYTPDITLVSIPAAISDADSPVPSKQVWLPNLLENSYSSWLKQSRHCIAGVARL